jgi:hypothetical protein
VTAKLFLNILLERNVKAEQEDETKKVIDVVEGLMIRGENNTTDANQASNEAEGNNGQVSKIKSQIKKEDRDENMKGK